MASGVLGLHGLLVLLPVEEESGKGLASVTVRSHSMEESHVWEIPNNMICAIRRIAQLMGVCQIPAFLEQNATATQMGLGHAGHVQQVSLAMVQSVRILMSV